MDSGIVAPPGSDEAIQADFQASLTSEVLAALMRSTWTWDDRAMRRDLSALLVAIAAAHHAPPSHGIGATLCAAAMAHIGCSSASVRVASLAAELVGESEAVTLRRALSASLLLGGPAVSHERLLERLGI